jgi:hypothetical protein
VVGRPLGVILSQVAGDAAQCADDAMNADSTHDTKEAAIARGTEIAKRAHGRLRIKGLDGRLEEEWVFPPRSRHTTATFSFNPPRGLWGGVCGGRGVLGGALASVEAVERRRMTDATPGVGRDRRFRAGWRPVGAGARASCRWSYGWVSGVGEVHGGV